MSTQQLHTSLLRNPIAQILRATGFHSTKPSVLDTLTNIAERYLLLLATTTAAHTQASHNSPIPTITDVRMALSDCGALTSSLCGAEEEWRERLRRPYGDYDDLPYGALRREKELQRREEEDTRDVREFVAWVTGDRNKEIRRVAGMLSDPEGGVGAGAGATDSGAGAAVGAGPGLGTAEMQAAPEDYLTALKKKHARTGQEERYAGTALGRQAEDRGIKIEGGPVESLGDWRAREVQAGIKGEVALAADVNGDEEMEDAPP